MEETFDGVGRPRPVGRPPLEAGEVAERVSAYCKRYGVSASPEGLPPFPSGERETTKHREWLSLYRAVRRLSARRLPASMAPRSSDANGTCAVCNEPVDHGGSTTLRVDSRSWPVHASCADLAERCRAAGREALMRLASLLWPPRRPRP